MQNALKEERLLLESIENDVAREGRFDGVGTNSEQAGMREIAKAASMGIHFNFLDRDFQGFEIVLRDFFSGFTEVPPVLVFEVLKKGLPASDLHFYRLLW